MLNAIDSPLAHELAHALIGECKNAKPEKAMDRFAGAFLVPADHLREEVGTGRTAFAYEELVRLKHLYGVSMWALLYRLQGRWYYLGTNLKNLFRTPARAWLKAEPEELKVDGETARLEKPQRFEAYVYRALGGGYHHFNQSSRAVETAHRRCRARGQRQPVKDRRIVINDASCLIDLHKVELVEVMLQLPYQFVVALPVATTNFLISLRRTGSVSLSAGLVQIDLDSSQVGRAIAFRSQNIKLTAEDCFSLVLAEDNDGSILLTGDAELRSIAVGKGCEVHGVIWVTDEIHGRGLLANNRLAECLTAWLNDPLVRLPENLLHARLRALMKK